MTNKIRTALCILALMAISTAAPAQEESVTLTVSVGSPANSNICDGYLKDWVERVEEASNKRLTFELVCDNILSTVGDTIERVGYGVADIGWDVPGIYGKRFDALNVVSVPGVYDDPADAGAALWKLHENGQLKADWGNTRPLWFQAVQNSGFFFMDKPVGPNDFTGEKIASSNAIRAQLTRAAGGVPISLPTPEYYQALANGAADGVMTTPGALEATSLDELVNYFVYGPFGGGVTVVVINTDVYNNLPADLRQILDEHTQESASRIVSQQLYDYEQNFVDTKMLTREGTELVRLTDDDLAIWKARFDEARETWAASVDGGAEVVAAFAEAVEQETASSAE